MMKTGQIKRCQGLEKLRGMWWLCATTAEDFFVNCISKNDSFVSKRDLAM